MDENNEKNKLPDLPDLNIPDQTSSVDLPPAKLVVEGYTVRKPSDQKMDDMDTSPSDFSSNMDTQPENDMNIDETNPIEPDEPSKTSTTDVDFYPLYLIVPTGYSRFISVIMVLIIFGIYLILIGYMTSYQLKFVPNYYMLWDFMVGMNSKKYNDEFTRYLNTSLAYATAEMQKDSFVGTKEQFTTKIDNETEGLVGMEYSSPTLATQISNFFKIFMEKITKIFNQVMLTSFVHGKKVKVSRA